MNYPAESFPGQNYNLELMLSNLSLPPSQVATASAHGLAEEMATIHAYTEHISSSGIGYNGGYEITPTRRLVMSAIGDESWDFREQTGHDAPLASRLHDTWAPSLKQIWAGKRSPLDIAGYLAMPPQGAAGRSVMRYMSRSLLDGVPLTAFPEGGWDGPEGPYDLNALAGSYDGVHTQLTPETFLMRGQVDPRRLSLEGIALKLREQGVDGAIIDSHHILEESTTCPGFRLPAMAILGAMYDSPSLLPVEGVHIAVGRTDAPNPEDVKRSVAELDALLKGPEAFARTEAGAVMTASAEIWASRQHTDRAEKPVFQAVVETTYSALRQSHSRTSTGTMSHEDGRKRLAALADHSRAFFDGVLSRAA